MTIPDADGGLEMGDVMTFQRRSWSVQRIGWIVMLLLIVAGLAGLFGSGPVAHASVGSRESTLFLKYDRFVRLYARHTVSVEVDEPVAATDSTAQVWLDQEWLSGNEIVSIIPTPVESWNAGGRIYYLFRIVPGSGRSVITIAMNSQSAGFRNGRIGLASQAGHSFWQFTYP